MPNGTRWVGLDVHAHASAAAVFDDLTGEVITGRVNGRPMEVLDVLREFLFKPATRFQQPLGARARDRLACSARC